MIWDAQTGAVHATRDIRRAMSSAAWSPSADTIAASVSAAGAPSTSDAGVDAMYSTYGLEEDEALEAFELSGSSDDGLLDDGGAAFVRMFDVDSALQLGTLASAAVDDQPRRVVWQDHRHILAATDNGIARWNARYGHFVGFLPDGTGDFVDVATSSDAAYIVGAQANGSVRIWSTIDDSELQSLASDEEELTCLAASAGAHRLAVGSAAGGIQVWDGLNEEPDVWTLEGHGGPISGVTFSSDGKILASASTDGLIRLWEASSWQLLAEIRDRSMTDAPVHLAFSPTSPVLAVTTEDGKAVRLLELDGSALAIRQRRPKTVNYVNAKVVLLGDSGVGKTGLGLVLARQVFRATESTHRRNVWLLSTTSTTGESAENREVYLWDLAGQPGYRLLHQLHLSDVAVALIVFDARSEVDPLAGVRYWARALSQAERQRPRSAGPIPRILVAARMDRAGAKVDDKELQAVRERFDITRYETTSAKTGAGISDLRGLIDLTIDWEALPKVRSTEFFDSIRRFLLALRDSDRVLSRESDLLAEFLAKGGAGAGDVEAEFRTCVERAQARGIVRRLSFGDLILLNPEVLDAYAAAVLQAAASMQLGAIKESDVREGRFPIPPEDRLAHAAAENLLLIATIEDLLHHEVALREDSGDGTYLVFPSQVTRHAASIVDAVTTYSFSFDGPVQQVWATVVVRLAHSGIFTLDSVGANIANFRAFAQAFALRLTLIDEGSARLDLQAERGSDPAHQLVLQEFVRTHLRKRAIATSIQERAITACECGFVVPEQMLAALAGRESMNCPVCPRSIALDRTAAEIRDRPSEVASMERAADRERTRLTSRATVAGKEAVREYDVFLAHNSRDKEAVGQLAERLRDRGFNPWLDRDEIPPGRWFQEVIQAAVAKVGSAAVILGKHGVGKWEALEIRTFVTRCVDDGIPVIPVLLPDGGIPEELPFLRELQYVRFHKSIEEHAAFDQLVWGITADHSSGT